MEQILLAIFSIIGILAFILVAYYFGRKLYDKPAKKVKIDWPPTALMKMSDAQCPDYWINTGSLEDNNITCENKFHLTMVDPNQNAANGFTKCADVKCSDNNDGKSKTFPTVTKWPVKGRNDIVERCLWRDCCGPQVNIPAGWVGIEKTCGY